MPTTRTRSSSRNPVRREGSEEEGLSRTGSIDETRDEAPTRMTRKRHREASTEPSASGGVVGSSSLPAIPLKKNRTEEPLKTSATASAAASDDDNDIGESNNETSVDETREKVEKLSHDEKAKSQGSRLLAVEEEDAKDDAASVDMEASASDIGTETGQKRKMLARAESANLVHADAAKRIKEDDVIDEELPLAEAQAEVGGDVSKPAEEVPPPAPIPVVPSTPVKKPQATFGSFSSASSPFASAKPTASALSGSTSGSSLSNDISAKVREANNLSTTSSSESLSTPAPVKKPQATFGSFSSAASPFGAVKSSSTFAAQPVASSSNAPNALNSFKSTVSASSAFGGWSSGAKTVSSPFATPAKKTAVKEGDDDEVVAKEGDSEETTAETDKPQSSFGDILSKSEVGPKEEKVKVDLAEQQAHTGEEDEDTVYQVRCKLHIMDESGAWRERGTGSLRVNIDKKRSGSAPRLVMRAEGVLRLILNVSMFPNMSFDVTDKYVRTVVFEDGQSRSILIRTASSKMAEELKGKLLEHVPKTAVVKEDVKTDDNAVEEKAEIKAAE